MADAVDVLNEFDVVFCIGSLEESLKGSLALDFKEGQRARLDSVSIKSITSNDGKDVIPDFIQTLGLPEKSSDSYNEDTDHTPVLLGKFFENEFKSGKWLSLSGASITPIFLSDRLEARIDLNNKTSEHSQLSESSGDDIKS